MADKRRPKFGVNRALSKRTENMLRKRGIFLDVSAEYVTDGMRGYLRFYDDFLAGWWC